MHEGYIRVEFVNGEKLEYILPPATAPVVAHFLCVQYAGDLHYINCDQVVSFTMSIPT